GICTLFCLCGFNMCLCGVIATCSFRGSRGSRCGVGKTDDFYAKFGCCVLVKANAQLVVPCSLDSVAGNFDPLALDGNVVLREFFNYHLRSYSAKESAVFASGHIEGYCESVDPGLVALCRQPALFLFLLDLLSPAFENRKISPVVKGNQSIWDQVISCVTRLYF